jgi:hypothetical protein
MSAYYTATAGEHPLEAVVYRSQLRTYDSLISTHKCVTIPIPAVRRIRLVTLGLAPKYHQA